jgi:hypothetical protein
MKKAIFGLALLWAIPACSWAALTTITFTELPPQPANGVSLNGVTFGFAGGTATFDAPNGGQLTYVQDPSLEGQSVGKLTLTFATPAPFVRFGVALSTAATLTPGCTVSLVGPGGPLGTFPVNTTNLKGFTEGQFVYSGSPVTTATITFNSGAASAFAIDNLSFGTIDAVPALDSRALALLAVTMIGLGGWVVRRRALHPPT